MPPRRTISSRGSEASRDNELSRTTKNLNIPPRVTEQVEAPPPTVEGISHMLNNWERLIEIQTHAIEIQVQAAEAHAQVSKSQTQDQSSMTSGSTFEQFKKLNPPACKGESDPIVAESWTLDFEKYFDVLNCSETQKVVFTTFMLGSEAEHWWRMEKRLLGNEEPLVWDKFKEVFFKKYFLRSVRRQKEYEFI